MKWLFLFLAFMVSITLVSCEDRRLTEYKKIVDQAARFKIYFPSEKKSVFLKQDDVPRFKQVLVGEVNADTVSSFIADTRIELIDSKHRQIASIVIVHNNAPTANFNSAGLNFGFRLPYRLGMWVSELRREL